MAQPNFEDPNKIRRRQGFLKVYNTIQLVTIVIQETTTANANASPHCCKKVIKSVFKDTKQKGGTPPLMCYVKTKINLWYQPRQFFTNLRINI